MPENNNKKTTIKNLRNLSEGQLYYLECIRMYASSLIRSIDNVVDLAMELVNKKTEEKPSQNDEMASEILCEALDNYYTCILDDIQELYSLSIEAGIVDRLKTKTPVRVT